jgi:hypothetical protein
MECLRQRPFSKGFRPHLETRHPTAPCLLQRPECMTRRLQFCTRHILDLWYTQKRASVLMLTVSEHLSAFFVVYLGLQQSLKSQQFRQSTRSATSSSVSSSGGPSFTSGRVSGALGNFDRALADLAAWARLTR